METENLSQGLQIVGVGVGGVFLNLLALMCALYLVGVVFGKKQSAKGGKAQAAKKKPSAKGASAPTAKKKAAVDAAAKATESASEQQSTEPVEKPPG